MTDEMDLLEPDADDMIVLTDEDGNDVPLQVLARLSLNGSDYMVLSDSEDEDSVMIFRVATDEDGEELLNPVEDEDECQLVFYLFQAEFDDYEFCDAE